MGATVVGKPAATVTTSSPGRSLSSPRSGEVSAETARRFADEPEFTRIASRTPTISARRRSSSSAKRPVVNQPSRAASTSACSSRASKTRPATGTVERPFSNGRAGNAAA